MGHRAKGREHGAWSRRYVRDFYFEGVLYRMIWVISNDEEYHIMMMNLHIRQKVKIES
jgi:hypothetical protein